MMQDERFIRIIDFLKENQTGTLAELSELNGVSLDTVRRDLEQLEKSKMLRRVRGGAVYHNADITTHGVGLRSISHKREKREIAEVVSSRIVDGQAILINSGTTCMEVAELLVERFYRLTVMTNSLPAIRILSQNKKFNIIIPGGIVDGQEEAICGEQCPIDIRKYNLDMAILGVHAVSLEKGITDFRIHQEPIMRAMLESSRQKIIVADHSKFEKISYVNICSLAEIDSIITDSGLAAEMRRKYTEQGIEVIAAESE
ncbi:DeoR/GlpR family DNA-binding transcription regulator [Clostridium transplantifaecale]|uniref:DeoR/GlpR family DNA-binding transcription regulator n=1 Tax=Clostridium transplantifaecale TaxID=2479838 RepID=UPI000F63ACBF|nr:DeoR/GlpR family DNA-binding transcription regulator [Clostridium transplantifaecale]